MVIICIVHLCNQFPSPMHLLDLSVLAVCRWLSLRLTICVFTFGIVVSFQMDYEILTLLSTGWVHWVANQDHVFHTDVVCNIRFTVSDSSNLSINGLSLVIKIVFPMRYIYINIYIKLLKQGFLLVKLKSSLPKFYSRYHDFINRYRIYVLQMTMDMFHLS